MDIGISTKTNYPQIADALVENSLRLAKTAGLYIKKGGYAIVQWNLKSTLYTPIGLKLWTLCFQGQMQKFSCISRGYITQCRAEKHHSGQESQKFIQLPTLDGKYFNKVQL